MARWYCSAIYASPTHSIRLKLWDHLMDLRNLIRGPWLLLGDFNEIRSCTEVVGGDFIISRANSFSHMMDNCSVMDLDTIGGFFTWRRNTRFGGHLRKKLDRCLADVDWRMTFPDSLAELLPTHDSDHNPILVSCMKANSRRPKSFHFQAAWLSHPDYEPLVHTTWCHAHGDVVTKLRAIQDTSIRFNKEVFGNIYKNKRLLEARIKGVHIQLDSCQSSDLVNFEKFLQQEYNKVLVQEEMIWYQKSREKWVKYDEEVLKNSALSYFKSIFQQGDSINPFSLQFDYFPQITTDLFNCLSSLPSMDEVKSALFSMDSFKAPGPDGFQPIFFKKFWHIVAPDVFKLISTAFISGTIAPKLAETLIVPIPKINDPTTLKDFRPISLCNVLLKVISKIIVRRIRPYMNSLVSPFQSSFIPSRSTSDNAIIAQEIVHYMHNKKGKKGHLLFKIDFEKAYDRVNWDFLKLTLQDFGFPISTTNLIMNCITASSLSLKWNNEKLPSFSPNRGLRQGDPLSPYLFVLCMEKLSLMIQEKVKSNHWKPVKISRHEPAISHLFFADDCLFFTEAKSPQSRMVKQVLHSFCHASGLKVNIQKSRFMASHNISRVKVAKFESIVHFNHNSHLGKYLGFPMLSGRIKNSDFSFIMDKINGRLDGWKSKLLSRAGRSLFIDADSSDTIIWGHSNSVGLGFGNLSFQKILSTFVGWFFTNVFPLMPSGLCGT
ncbi:hypothetical protein TSUD_302990 [Trifolium subterraneum]|uniref:Reverse transcriptase domain-containing protein n=1 Tax=Trifolium subterraneum TaxID=3900 RepID=A0A2Z6NKS9_TRISU|nr:hypothetical protein TSUD_302990 [Trifolium subterraneum]